MLDDSPASPADYGTPLEDLIEQAEKESSPTPAATTANAINLKDGDLKLPLNDLATALGTEGS